MKNLNRVHLGSLRAVEAVGRLGSLKGAAAELGVTPGAISQQIRKAEEQLGLILFERRPKGLTLTSMGESILVPLNHGFSELSSAVHHATQKQNNTLTLSVAPVFAGKWLVWRLQDFNRKHPDIRIRVEATNFLTTPGHDDIDACIRVGTGPWPDVKAAKLVDHRIFPVCSPAFASVLQSPSDLSRVPIIRDQGEMFSWNNWLEPNGLDDTLLKEGPSFSDGSLCLDAAIAGQGVFLAWETLASDALKARQIIAPFPGRYPTGFAYWLITAGHEKPAQMLQDLEHWLREELGKLG
ncbi:MAG: LysR substrate-binding domain-containing protein [Sneathiella sp.]